MATKAKKKSESFLDKARRVISETSDTLNPVKRAQPAARRVMDRANDEYNAGRRRRLEDAEAEALGTKKRKRP